MCEFLLHSTLSSSCVCELYTGSTVAVSCLTMTDVVFGHPAVSSLLQPAVFDLADSTSFLRFSFVEMITDCETLVDYQIFFCNSTMPGRVEVCSVEIATPLDSRMLLSECLETCQRTKPQEQAPG